MRKFLLLTSCVLMLTAICGCAGDFRLPSEDIEIPSLYSEEISVLRNPSISPMSHEKYLAAKSLIRKVDFSFTRETKTLNDLFYYGDAAVDNPRAQDRIITFNYQYGNSYVRFVFHVSRNFVLRTEVIEK